MNVKELVIFLTLQHVHCLTDREEVNVSTCFAVGSIEHGFDSLTKVTWLLISNSSMEQMLGICNTVTQ